VAADRFIANFLHSMAAEKFEKYASTAKGTTKTW